MPKLEEPLSPNYRGSNLGLLAGTHHLETDSEVSS